ncbi:Aspartate 1-decarboxylase [Pyrobaculum oguniense TE7]|uniref:Aspartate 1-decarboxylase n=1 Tax=Pyrobaculum oguniense (strain DSM 13380 / JCM 10595 / TE7) TaxID=698757 RepID=H6QB28_PYROT|nr:Aspartate 1-decarboxylase [Pyrobaculum oguniense TE7]
MPIMLRAKAHGLVVTGKNINYEGSLTLGVDILKAVGLYPLERVEVYNVTNGARFSTYVIPGPEGAVELNGAAARLGEIGDVLIVAAYECVKNPEEHQAVVAIFRNNKPIFIRKMSPI